VQDRPGGRAILARLAAAFPTVGLVWADGGYANHIDNSLLTWAADKLRLTVEIVKRSDDVKGFQVLPRRWVVERTFGWLVRNPPPGPRLRTPDRQLRNHDQDRDDPAHGHPARRRTNPMEQPHHVITRIPNSHSESGEVVGNIDKPPYFGDRDGCMRSCVELGAPGLITTPGPWPWPATWASPRRKLAPSKVSATATCRTATPPLTRGRHSPCTSASESRGTARRGKSAPLPALRPTIWGHPARRTPPIMWVVVWAVASGAPAGCR
jgi:transposase